MRYITASVLDFFLFYFTMQIMLIKSIKYIDLYKKTRGTDQSNAYKDLHRAAEGIFLQKADVKD